MTRAKARSKAKVAMRPCPWPDCGGAAKLTSELSEMSPRGGWRFCECTKCEAAGPKRATDAQALEAWNAEPMTRCKPSRKKPRTGCIGCGCTDDFACPGGCAWMPGKLAVCTNCVHIVGRLEQAGYVAP